MPKPRDLWQEICSIENLLLAYRKARKHKTLKLYIIEFEKDLRKNILLLQWELLTFTYAPKPLETFIIRDPKTRKISKSDFRDRIIHHAVCNIIEPIFEKTFIYDSYANRIGKGTLNAIIRFDEFKRIVSKNNTKTAYVLKADIRKYFDNVDHETLIKILERKIKDKNIISLIRIILCNHKTNEEGKGMPLGNLTSQFFANIYLNELDQYIKHELKLKYYIRYVDDFVIIDNNEETLETYKILINQFLNKNLSLELHPEKTKIISIKKGIGLLGIRIFPHHTLLLRRNIRKFRNHLSDNIMKYKMNKLIYDKVYDCIEGWVAYSKTADSYNLRNKTLIPYYMLFVDNISTKEYNRHINGK